MGGCKRADKVLLRSRGGVREALHHDSAGFFLAAARDVCPVVGCGVLRDHGGALALAQGDRSSSVFSGYDSTVPEAVQMWRAGQKGLVASASHR
jgi:hypothetical protein